MHRAGHPCANRSHRHFFLAGARFCAAPRTVRSSVSAAIVGRCGGPTPGRASVGITLRSRPWANLGWTLNRLVRPATGPVATTPAALSSRQLAAEAEQAPGSFSSRMTGIMKCALVSARARLHRLMEGSVQVPASRLHETEDPCRREFPPGSRDDSLSARTLVLGSSRSGRVVRAQCPCCAAPGRLRTLATGCGGGVASPMRRRWPLGGTGPSRHRRRQAPLPRPGKPGNRPLFHGILGDRTCFRARREPDRGDAVGLCAPRVRSASHEALPNIISRGGV